PAVPSGVGSVIHVTRGPSCRAWRNEAKTSSRYGDDNKASPTPCAARSSRTWSRNGRSTSGMSGFGMVSVSGRSRVPSPPTRTTAFTSPLVVAPRDVGSPEAQQGPGERSKRGAPSRGLMLHEVRVDALGVLERHPALARRGRRPDVYDLELGREPNLPSRVSEAGAQVHVLHVHEVALVEEADLVQGGSSEQHRGTRHPVDGALAAAVPVRQSIPTRPGIVRP